MVWDLGEGKSGSVSSLGQAIEKWLEAGGEGTGGKTTEIEKIPV